MPSLYIITGPNGSGKSSAGPGFLPDSIKDQYPPFDGDKLTMTQQVLIRKNSGCTYKEAKRLAEGFVFDEFKRLYKKALRENDHFVYEGHFSEESSWDLIRKFRKAGYRIDMIFLGLISIELSSDRVFHRAKAGGHKVEAFDIEKNYYGNLYNLNKHLRLIDQLTLLDTSRTIPLHIGQMIDGTMQFFINKEQLPAWVIDYLPNLLKKSSKNKA